MPDSRQAVDLKWARKVFIEHTHLSSSQIEFILKHTNCVKTAIRHSSSTNIMYLQIWNHKSSCTHTHIQKKYEKSIYTNFGYLLRSSSWDEGNKRGQSMEEQSRWIRTHAFVNEKSIRYIIEDGKAIESFLHVFKLRNTHLNTMNWSRKKRFDRNFDYHFWDQMCSIVLGGFRSSLMTLWSFDLFGTMKP